MKRPFGSSCKRPRPKGEHQWCLELADMVTALVIHKDQAIEIKAKALVALADLTTSAIGRNYYLAYAKELREKTG